MRIYLFYIGKVRDVHANAIAAEYMKRTERYGKTEIREIQPNRFELWEKHPAAVKILLDPGGKSLSSFQFADVISKAERDSRDLVFVVGGAEGLPAGWREQADWLLSLSAMTYPHELARAMLAEQIYRGFTILRGHPYPK